MLGGVTGSLALPGTVFDTVGGGPVRGWSARLAPSVAPETGTAAVAAWSTDADGAVLEFVAAPTGP